MASLKKRGTTYYIQFYRNGKEVRKSLDTASHQVAREKLRQFESARARGNDDPLPTRTPIAPVVTAYVAHIHQTKTRNGYKVDLWYLRKPSAKASSCRKAASRLPHEHKNGLSDLSPRMAAK